MMSSMSLQDKQMLCPSQINKNCGLSRGISQNFALPEGAM